MEQKITELLPITIIELSKLLDIYIPDVINDYSNQFDDFESIEEIRDFSALNEKCSKFSDYISEYADYNVPVYNHDIEKEYKNCDFTIDDVLYEGLLESLESEGNIIKAKSIALFLDIQNKTFSEVSDFESELIEKIEEKLK